MKKKTKEIKNKRNIFRTIKEFLIRKRNPRNVAIASLIIVAALIGAIGGTVFTYYLGDKNNTDSSDKLEINKDLKEFSELYESIIKDYYKTVDKDTILESAIQGMISALNDPYASYLNEDEKQSFDERMQGEYYGIGVELSSDTTNPIVITNVFDNTPAQKAGLIIGDVIVGVDEEDMSTMTTAKLATYIKTKQGNTTKLDIKRGDKVLNLSITRAKVILTSATGKVIIKNDKKVGYINISLFANNTYTQFKEASEALEDEDITSLIIDVRNNSGGYLHIANKIVSMFLAKENIIYQLETKDGTQKIYDLSSEKRSYPVSILINEGSASASEILAAAFKDNYNSQLIGRKTYGKGTVQETIDTGNGAMIKFTVQNWLTPKGASIDGVGLEPTINIALDAKYLTDPIDDNDNQLQTALDLLTK